MHQMASQATFLLSIMNTATEQASHTYEAVHDSNAPRLAWLVAMAGRRVAIAGMRGNQRHAKRHSPLTSEQNSSRHIPAASSRPEQPLRAIVDIARTTVMGVPGAQ